MKTGIYWQDPAYPAKGIDFIFDPSLVLYLPLYRLDGASFMSKDASGHLCTVTGALWSPQGRSFDGVDDYINCGNDTVLKFGTGDFTIESWLKRTDAGSSWQWIVTCSPYPANDSGWRVGVNHNDKYIFRDMKAEPSVDVIGATSFAQNVFEHLVIIRCGTSLKIYLNGIEDGSGTVSSDFDDTNTTFIGKTEGTASWLGLIGEVRLYRRALTPLEILRNYLATKWRYR